MAQPLFGGDGALTPDDLLDIETAEENARVEGFPTFIRESRQRLRSAPLSDLFADANAAIDRSRQIARQQGIAPGFPANPDERRIAEEIGRRIARDLPRVGNALVDLLGKLPSSQGVSGGPGKGDGVAQPIGGGTAKLGTQGGGAQPVRGSAPADGQTGQMSFGELIGPATTPAPNEPTRGQKAGGSGKQGDGFIRFEGEIIGILENIQVPGDNIIGPELTPRDAPAVKAKDDKIS